MTTEDFKKIIVLISVHSGNVYTPFNVMQKEIERLAGRPVFTHELGSHNQAMFDNLGAKALEELSPMLYELWPELKKADFEE